MICMDLHIKQVFRRSCMQFAIGYSLIKLSKKSEYYKYMKYFGNILSPRTQKACHYCVLNC